MLPRPASTATLLRAPEAEENSIYPAAFAGTDATVRHVASVLHFAGQKSSFAFQWTSILAIAWRFVVLAQDRARVRSGPAGFTLDRVPS